MSFALCQHNAEWVRHTRSQTYPIRPPLTPLCSDTPSCRTLLWDTLVGHPRLLRVLKPVFIFQLPSDSAYGVGATTTHSPVLIFQLPRYSAYSSCTTKSPVLIFQLPRYSAYYSCPTKSPVLIFQLPRDSAYYSCTTTSPVLIFQLHRYSATAPTKVALQRRQLSSSSSPDTPRIKLYSDVASSHLPARQILRVLQLYYQVSSHLPAPQILRVLNCQVVLPQVASPHLPAAQILRILQLPYQVASSQLYYNVASSHLPAPQILRDCAY